MLNCVTRRVGSQIVQSLANATCSSVVTSRVLESTRTFATAQQLKQRMNTAKSVGKITSAMKMVAAAKLRGVQSQLANALAFGQTVAKSYVASAEDQQQQGSDAKTAAPASKNILLVPLTSDRGLCGAVNSYVIKQVKAMAPELKKNGHNVSLLTVGEKARAGLDRNFREYMVGNITDVGKSKAATFREACLIAEHILAQPEVDEIVFIYNHFKSAVSYDTTRLVQKGFTTFLQDDEYWTKFEVEGGENREVLQNLYEYRLAVLIYQMLIDSATSEQSARMNAMDSSNKNAKEMLRKLTVLYNRTRQAKITTELIEIISGAASLDDAKKN